MNNEQKQVKISQACTSLRVRQYMWKHENTLECQKKSIGGLLFYHWILRFHFKSSLNLQN